MDMEDTESTGNGNEGIKIKFKMAIVVYISGGNAIQYFHGAQHLDALEQCYGSLTQEEAEKNFIQSVY